MPELPEVESVRRLLERVLVTQEIADAEVVPDDIVFGKADPTWIREAIVGKTVLAVGRRGKVFWLELAGKTWLVGHLGMSGWVREVGGHEHRLLNHGNAPLDDPEGRPRFLKLLLTAANGRSVAFTDGRRLARYSIQMDQLELGPNVGRDVLLEPYSASELTSVLASRKGPIKSLLLDQVLFAGIGNWVADEVLYHAGIAPQRTGASLKPSEITGLSETILSIVEQAVAVNAESDQFPPDWLFHVRWGGKNGTAQIGGDAIVRESIGGRTTAWVPARQR
jgi:formamidopyrimidine-DNA glycosylase